MTGIGGGTLRDVLLGANPVFWIDAPAYLIACVAVSSIVFFTAHVPKFPISFCSGSMRSASVFFRRRS